jgi:hypothetical protein
VYYEKYSSVIRAKMKDARKGNQRLASGKEAEIDSGPEPDWTDLSL